MFHDLEWEKNSWLYPSPNKRNPFSNGGVHSVHKSYCVYGSDKEEIKRIVERIFRELENEEKYVRVENKPIKFGKVKNKEGKVIGWELKGEFICFEKISQEFFKKNKKKEIAYCPILDDNGKVVGTLFEENIILSDEKNENKEEER